MTHQRKEAIETFLRHDKGVHTSLEKVAQLGQMEPEAKWVYGSRKAAAQRERQIGGDSI